MEFEKNTLLFGADPTPRIVAVELGETGTVRVHRRETDGSTITDVEPFHPFVWADSDVVDLGIETEKLRGDLKYGWLITADSWKELIALRNGLKNAGRDFFAFTDSIQHYLTATGRTLFKDLGFEEVKRMQLEVLQHVASASSRSPGNSRQDADATTDHIMSIALCDNTGWEEIIIVDANNREESERNALKRLTALIKERDPDVIEGHDLFRVHLPLLVARAKKLKTKLDWGRSGGFLRSRPSRLQIAEKTIDYPKYTLDGRHFVDTFLLAQFYDVGMRSLAGFERADVARHFELCDSEQVSGLSGKELERAYLADSDLFQRRALCGVRQGREGRQADHRRPGAQRVRHDLPHARPAREHDDDVAHVAVLPGAGRCAAVVLRGAGAGRGGAGGRAAAVLRRRRSWLASARGRVASVPSAARAAASACEAIDGVRRAGPAAAHRGRRV